jgi:hypothetical protein
MTIAINVEMTSKPGEIDRKANFDVIIRSTGTPRREFTFDMFEDKNLLDHSYEEIFELMKACDPEALQALDASYNEGDKITFNDVELDGAEKAVVLNVCSTTRGMTFG